MSEQGKPRGSIIVLAAPSGGGKTTLVRQLCQQDPKLSVSVSHTTRSRRPHEKDGQDYFFVAEDTFLTMVEEGAFLEHATVFGRRYGTTCEQIEAKIANGQDVLLDIDWQGMRQLKQRFDQVLSVFILPPSKEQLSARLVSRRQDQPEVIRQRMSQACSEISHCEEFDYWVVNDNLAKAVADIHAIICANRLSRERQCQTLGELLSNLLGE